MRREDLPGLYRSADDLSRKAQKSFHAALGVYFALLALAAIPSALPPIAWLAAIQAIALAICVGLSIFLYHIRPDQVWYGSRAVAESVKTLSWRYVVRAEPFDNGAPDAGLFLTRLRTIVQQNERISSLLELDLTASQITPAMDLVRAGTFDERRTTYLVARVNDQLEWYSEKAKTNRRLSAWFFWLLIAATIAALVSAGLRPYYVEQKFWPTDIFAATAGGILGWLQVKRHSELASSYALTASEIALVRDQIREVSLDSEFSRVVGDAENAFSREHTQWLARRDG